MSNVFGANISVALIHWPVLNKAQDVVATNVTNFDIHDIARCCRTYGVNKYFIVNRVEEQLIVVNRMLEHWRIKEGSVLNPMRRTALNMIELEETLERVLERHYSHQRPFILATAARDFAGLERLSFKRVREGLQAREWPEILILFGTGYGLAESILKQCNGLIEPIRGSSTDDYRHLAVRSAVSICLDRLLGTW